ncbi:hypothetical protein GCM10017788_32990 [Amycolatopsis acidiphila]|nr:hypothetical protein GCM10017788_32990 [Amycolatopsis acidiphila]
MRPCGEEPVGARTLTETEGLFTLREWARASLTALWSEQTLLDALVVLEELVSHVRAEGVPAQVRLSYRGANRVHIEVDDERAEAVPLGADVGAVLIRHLARGSGAERHRGHTTFWADVSLVPRHIPAKLPGVRAVAPFEPDGKWSRN